MTFLIILPWLAPLLAATFGFGFAFSVFQLRRRLDRMRTKAMQSLAQTLGCDFFAEDSLGLLKQLQEFDLFKRERKRMFAKGKVSNVLRTMIDDTEVFMFDYMYTVQAGKSRKRVNQTVFFANDKQWYLPNFHLSPENWWHKVQAKLGLSTDINFEGDDRFSEKFWLKGDFEDLVREQFNPDLRGFLSQKPPAHVEGKNYYMIAYKPNKKLDPEQAAVFFRNCCDLVREFKQKGNLEQHLLDLNVLPEKEPIPAEKRTDS